MSTADGNGTYLAPEQALGTLRSRLDDARVDRGLSKTQLAGLAGLGRTVVSQALSQRASPPSKDTVRALARALRLQLPPLLELLAAGVAGTTGQHPDHRRAAGRPVADWDPVDLGVHPAAPAPLQEPDGLLGHGGLPDYAPRPHDDALNRVVAEAADGHSRMRIMVGSSSTGKTRACWEAVRPLADHGWRLWHPLAPTRAEAALVGLGEVGPRTVVWLDEAQHYLAAGQGYGEQLAAGLAELLTDPDRAPVLVLGTLWYEHAEALTTIPYHRPEDPHAHARALLINRRISVPDTFDNAALTAAWALADGGDAQLAHALRHVVDGRLTQDLAGGPELMYRYRAARPAARAVLWAAMDARRLGAGLFLPFGFLRDAAEGYLTDAEYDVLREDWFEQALTDLARPVHGNLAPLRSARPRRARSAPGTPHSSSFPHWREGPVYRLADYLEQHGRQERALLCPPASFWHAASDHLIDPDDLANLARAALQRYRLQWAFHLHQRSGVCSPTGVGVEAYVMRMRETAGDVAETADLVRGAADAGRMWALLWLAARGEGTGDVYGAEELLRQAAGAGHLGALVRLTQLRQEAGDEQEARLLVARVAEMTGHPKMHLPSMILNKEGDAPARGHGTGSLASLVSYVWAIPTLVTQTQADGTVEVLFASAEVRGRQADPHSAQALLAQARDAWPQDPQDAETLARRAVDLAGPEVLTPALDFLAQLRAEALDFDEAEALAWRTAGPGEPGMLLEIALMRGERGDRKGAQRLLRSAADMGSTYALLELAELRRLDGDDAGAEALAQQAACAGDASAYLWLAQAAYGAETKGSVRDLVKQAADAGAFHESFFSSGMEPWLADGTAPWLVTAVTSWWPYGLDADGTPSTPW
ncbi:helix-turn-helix domain-containing protein [Streptomyces sp. NPDC058272]|uniref:helix-turn-helix domain-containing protein n=1 Tax=Streptomyces sp. NPDC058272 TaxID=3346415 RepID=UPI0036EDE2CF